MRELRRRTALALVAGVATPLRSGSFPFSYFVAALVTFCAWVTNLNVMKTFSVYDNFRITYEHGYYLTNLSLNPTCLLLTPLPPPR